MGRFVRIATLLSVYLAWICGMAFVDLSCQDDHTDGQQRYADCCECHHKDCHKVHFEQPHSCNHDHSCKLVFYDTDKKHSLIVEPAALCIAAQLEDNLSIENIHTIRRPRHYERGVPIRSVCITSRRGMRAPPVVA